MKKRRKISQLLWAILLALVLTLTFLAYLQASFVLNLANRFILC
jgi:hypothetical protein